MSSEFVVGLLLGIAAYWLGGWRLYAICALMVVAIYSCKGQALEDPNLNMFKTGININKRLTFQQKRKLQPSTNEFKPWIRGHSTETIVTKKLKDGAP